MHSQEHPQAPWRAKGVRKWAAVAIAALIFWVLFVAAAVIYAVMLGKYKYSLAMFSTDVSIVTLGVLFSLAIRAGLDRMPRVTFIHQLLLAAALVALLATPFEIAFRHMFHLLEGKPPVSEIRLGKLLSGGIFWMIPMGLWGAGTLAMLHDAEARRRERRLAEAQVQAHEAQVRALRYQINPHFLYNTLNSIAALILDRRNEEAEAMVLQLSSFFRASLSSDPFEDVPLADEIEHQLMYLDIEQARFRDALEVSIDLPPELGRVGVPSLILQPIVENALKHGLRGPGKPMTLTISARADGDRLSIEVSDDGRGAGADSCCAGTGTGLSNVERRLAGRYAGRSSVEAAGGPEGFKVRLTMPLQQAG